MCASCKQLKPLTEYYKDRSRKDGLQPRCKECDGKLRTSRRNREGDRERLYRYAAIRAQRKNREFTITLDDVVIPEVCPVLGMPMKRPSIDRVDSSKGYTPDNIRVISFRANMLKNCATPWELQAVLAYMLEAKKKPEQQ